MQRCGCTMGSVSSSVFLAAFLAFFLGIQSNAQSNTTQSNTTSGQQSGSQNCCSAQIAEPALPASASELVRQVIENELKQTASDEKYFYVVRRLTPSGEQTKEYVETDDGAIGRLIAINDQPLTAQQQEKEDARLQKQAADPEFPKKLRKEQKEEEEHINKIVKAMPDAFIFEYDGREDSAQYGQLVRIRFKPNPNFNPLNRETQVYHGMEGIMLIDNAEKRLIKIVAKLTQEVNFGWGIFGHLDKGGEFEVEQSKIGPHRQGVCMLKMQLTGRVLLFKKLNIDEKEITGNFRPAPLHLTLAEAVEVLKQQNTQLAVQQSGDSKAPAK